MSGQAIQGDTIRQPGPVAWPVFSGLMPPLADSYVPRTESGLTLADGLHPGETVVLVTADEAARALDAMGGTGKTQLAAAIAHTLWGRQAVELIVWVTASSRDAVLTSYAQALGDVGVPGTSGGAAAAASHFLAWLAEHHPAVAGGARRPHRPGGAGGALAVGRQRAGGGHHQPPGHRAGGPRPPRRGGRPVQPPRGPELPVGQAARPAGPAGRGRRSRHRARLPAHRPGPGRCADRRGGDRLPRVPGPDRRPAAAPGQPGRGPLLGRRHRCLSA